MDPDPRAAPPGTSRRPVALAAAAALLGAAALGAGLLLRPAPPPAALFLTPSASSSSAAPPSLHFGEAAAFLARQPGFLGIVVRDRRTNAVWRSGATDHLTWAASTVKLAMVVSLLEQARVGQVTLDAKARQQIADVLNWSSDDAADALWNRYEGEKMVPRFTGKYGMAKLAFQAGFPHRWGHMKCTPDDLLALMGYIADKALPEDRTFLIDSMRSVGPVQRWGVWGAGPDQRPGNKDGWSVEPDGGSRHWVADSVGFAGPDERYLVAVMYHLPPSAGVAAPGIHAGAHAVSDLVATLFGAPVPAVVSVPDHD